MRTRPKEFTSALGVRFELAEVEDICDGQRLAWYFPQPRDVPTKTTGITREEVERLVALAVDRPFGPLTTGDAADLLDIDPERLSNGGVREVIELSLQGGDAPEWIEEMIVDR
jgi:hypothetical protein